MHKFIYILFRVTTYAYYRYKYKHAKSLRYNGYCISITGKGNLYCGENSYVSYFTRIYIDASAKVVIGDNTSIGHNVRIYTSKSDSATLIKDSKKELVVGDVIIGNNVLLGGNVYIGPGTYICDDVVVGANSVVTKSITQPGVYSGIPAKKIG